MAEMIRASPLFCHTHCVEAGVMSSIPLAACCSCPGCIYVIKIVLIWCCLMTVFFKEEKSDVHITVKWNK